MTAPIADQQDTIEWLLESSKRQLGAPVHNCFVQQGNRRSTRPGPLAHFVSARREPALDLYLLVLLRTAKSPHNVALAAGVWARALGMATPGTASSYVSRQWRWLAEQKLIARGRRGSWADVRVLREDGSGEPYSAGQKGGAWFHVPFEYWQDDYYRQLDLPAKALLLIALSLADDFYLPEEKGPAWYGISADTVGRGLRTLKDRQVLSERIIRKKAPGSPQGFTLQRHYTLRPPFGPKGKIARAAQWGVPVP